MSSTNRGSERRDDDYYRTPTWLISEFLNRFLMDYRLRSDALILDPCAGGDEEHGMPYPSCLAMYGYNVLTQDIRSDSQAALKGDYLLAKKPYSVPYDLVITNPPFTESVEITQKALTEAKTVVMLQRLNWIGSKKRRAFWMDAPLKHVYAHNKRASFTEDGRSDSIEYAHFVFENGYEGEPKFTIIL